jgi:hypothetical protein
MPTRPSQGLRLPLLAGWLFADLMLLLFVISLSFAPVQTPAAGAKATATPTLRPSPHPSPSARPQQRVLLQTYYQIDVNVDMPSLKPGTAAAGQLIQGTDNALGQLVKKYPSLRGKAVGVAVIFGAGPQTYIDTAIAEAATAGKILRAKDPRFSQASFLPEWTGGTAPTFVELILFFYAS